MTGADLPSCSVVICTYTPARLADLLAALDGVAAQQHRPDEVLIVVDHDDVLFEHLLRLESAWGEHGRPPLRVVGSIWPRGLSGARNTGLGVAGGEVVVFLDDDAVPDPDWLGELLQVFTADEVAGAGGRIDPGWPVERPWWFPVHLDWTVGCTIASMPADGGAVRNVFGASAAFRRDALQAIGGFPMELGRVGADGAGCEETDVCIRLRAEFPGTSIVYVPRSVVTHRVTNERCTPGYVVRRCAAEGRSKARLASRVGSAAAMSEERSFARVMGGAVLGDVVGSVRAPGRLGRAAVLTAGVVAAAGGYAGERVRLARGSTPR